MESGIRAWRRHWIRLTRISTKINSEEESRAIAARAYKWMLCAERPLSLNELAEAVSIPDAGTDELLEPVTAEDLKKICSNFIISDLADASVGEYVKRRIIDSIKPCSPEQANLQVVTSGKGFLL